jgi:beta-N-acetylhexosaminidase
MREGPFVFVGIPGAALDDATSALLSRWQPGGIVLFRRNLETGAQVQELVGGLRRLLPEAVLAIDCEGGRVDRLRDLLGPSPAAELLARRPAAAAERAGRWMGRALRLFDLDLDFAPVVDLDCGASDNAVDGRYLGATSAAVTCRAGAFLRGLGAAGVGGCLKHFPGLGAAAADTHFHTAVVRLGIDRRPAGGGLPGAPATLETLETSETSATSDPSAAGTCRSAGLAPHLEPYGELLPEAGAVMVAHAVYPEIDALERPASLSPPVIGGLLRGRLGFDGLCFSDDLEMKALDEWGDLPVRAEASFAAGCDVVLACATLGALPEIAERLASPRHAARRGEAERRLTAFRRRLATLRSQSGAAEAVGEDDIPIRLATLRAGRAALMAELLREES